LIQTLFMCGQMALYDAHRDSCFGMRHAAAMIERSGTSSE
jgi:hypothetical protein